MATATWIVPARALGGAVAPRGPAWFGRVLACVALAACSGDDAPPRAGGESAASPAPEEIWREGPRLPAPVTNNAVAALRGPAGLTVLSFLGMDSTKTWSGVTDATYRWDVDGDEAWREIAPVPGPPRLAATAQGLAGRVFVFGGYAVAEDGSETTLADVAVYDVGRDAWGWAADLPVPVDDAISGVWARSMIYLVSGWHEDANVADVQLFDPSLDRWSSATPIPGTPVFGHAGGIVGDDIVYVGGAKAVAGATPRFVADSGAWHGRIDATDPTRIEWQPIAHPPGPPVYRAAGAGANGLVLVVGGTDNPHDYDGVGYDAEPSRPVQRLLGYDPRSGWVELPPPPVATMDHRSLAVAGGRVFLVGGMLEGQRVSDRVWYADIDALLAAARGG